MLIHAAKMGVLGNILSPKWELSHRDPQKACTFLRRITLVAKIGPPVWDGHEPKYELEKSRVIASNHLAMRGTSASNPRAVNRKTQTIGKRGEVVVKSTLKLFHLCTVKRKKQMDGEADVKYHVSIALRTAALNPKLRPS